MCVLRLVFSDSPNVLKEGWRVVKKDPEDFDAWTRLITLAETQVGIHVWTS